MNWVKGDPYHIRADGWTICRINVGAQRSYELWNTKTQECVASVKADGDIEAAKAIKHLKEVASGL